MTQPSLSVPQPSIAELRKKLSELGAEDSAERADLLQRVAWELRNADAHEARRLAQEALTISERLDGEVPDTRTMEGFARVARAYADLRLSESDTAIDDAETAVAIFREFDEDLGLQRALNTLGIGYGDSNRFMDALEVFLELQKVCERNSDVRAEADALNNIAIIYVGLDDHSAALDYHLRSLRLARDIDYAGGEIRSLTNLGAVLYELARYDDALEHLEQSVALRQEGTDRHTFGITLVNLGRCYQQLGRHDDALDVLERAHTLLDQIDHSLGVAYALDSLGDLHLEHDTAKALQRLGVSLSIKESAQDTKGQATTLLRIAQAHRNLGRDDDAQVALDDALAKAVSIGARSEAYKAHRSLSELHEARGDLAKALEHYKIYTRIKDELFNESSDMKLRALRVGFEVEQAQQESEIYRLKNVELAQANHELKVLTRSLREADAQKSRLLAKVERQAREDALTGLANRRHFDQQVAETFAACRREGRRINVALSDIDDFKQVNDTFGHAVGDEVLRIVARLLEANTRDADLVARYGGEEFIVMLPDATRNAAHGVCERVRRAVAEYDWSVVDPELRVTLSMGLSSDPRIDHHEKMISVADDHLYQAKESGKNRVVVDVAGDIDLASTEPAVAAPAGTDPAPAPQPTSGADVSKIPQGIALGRANTPIETVTTQVGSVALLASRPHLEVTEGQLDSGGRLTLIPDDGEENAPEFYYLLSGTLECDLDGEMYEMRPGDRIVIEELEHPVTLTARDDVRFLYASPSPSFHEISAELDELRRLAVEVEFADGYTADHCARLQTIAYALGRELELPPHRLHLLDYGAYLHDVGKTKVPREILKKPTRLTASEWEIIRRHPTGGAELLENTFMAEAASIVAQHHERLDGSGYPNGLEGDEILLESYIVAVADTFDAMTTDRPYRGALPTEEALGELRRLRDQHFPAEVVDALERVLPTLSL